MHLFCRAEVLRVRHMKRRLVQDRADNVDHREIMMQAMSTHSDDNINEENEAQGRPANLCRNEPRPINVPVAVAQVVRPANPGRNEPRPANILVTAAQVGRPANPGRNVLRPSNIPITAAQIEPLAARPQQPARKQRRRRRSLAQLVRSNLLLYRRFLQKKVPKILTELGISSDTRDEDYLSN